MLPTVSVERIYRGKHDDGNQSTAHFNDLLGISQAVFGDLKTREYDPLSYGKDSIRGAQFDVVLAFNPRAANIGHKLPPPLFVI